MWPNPQFSAALVTSIEKTLNWKLQFWGIKIDNLSQSKNKFLREYWFGVQVDVLVFT